MEFAGIKLSEKLAFVAVLVAFVTALVFMARGGDIAALIVLTVLGTLALVVVGATIVVAAQGVQSKIQSRHFQENAQENLANMLIQQKVQNQLSAGAMTYAQKMQKLLGEPGQMPAQQQSPWELIEVDPDVLGGPGAWDTDIQMAQEEEGGW